jgi:hypothetical protein
MVSIGQNKDQHANRDDGSALTLSIKHYKPSIYSRQASVADSVSVPAVRTSTTFPRDFAVCGKWRDCQYWGGYGAIGLSVGLTRFQLLVATQVEVEIR